MVEYRALKEFPGWSHETYEKTPSYVVQYLLGIAAVEHALEKEENDRMKRDQRR